MEHIAPIIRAIFNSPILYIITLGIILLLVFSGKIKIHSRIVSLNDDAMDKERSVIRGQIEYARCFCLGLKKFISDENPYRELCVIEQLFNEIVQMIAFNHLRTDEDYIIVKQEKLWNIASSFTDEKIYQSDDFKALIFERTEKLIRELVRIRKIRS